MSGKFWTDSWNLVFGCKKCSEGCPECWLEKETYMRAHQKNPKISALRKLVVHMTGPNKGKWNGQVVCDKDSLDIPLRARKPRIYAIWSDLFHHAVTWEFQLRAFSRMVKCPQHTFLIVTKRPQNALKFAGHWGLIPDPVTGFTGSGEVIPDNIWLLVTMENQQRADERMPYLLRWPGKRGVIIEPCLGGVKLPLTNIVCEVCGRWNCNETLPHRMIQKPPIHQVILGPENGPRKRPFDIKWKESVGAQCEAADVPFYYKATGEGKLAWR